MGDEQLGFSTRAVRAAKRTEEVRQHPLAPPLYQAATFAFDDVDEFASVAQAKTSGGYLYSRWANPTVDALGAAMAELEGAEAGACFGSGMGAIHTTLSTLVEAGEHVVSAHALYGGTHSVMASLLPRAGVRTTLVDVTDLDAVEAAMTDGTKVLYAETIGNPTLPVADLDALAAMARARGARFVVDATFTPPVMLRPLEHGVDVVIHSATKYISGHSDVTAGVVCSDAATIEAVRRATIDMGAVLAPFEAWLTLRGLQTMPLRVDRICANAMAIAKVLEQHARVRRVLYPGLPSHPQHGLAQKLLGDRFGGMLAFEVASLDEGRRFLERVELASRAASLGGNSTLVVHPASVTHTQLSPEQRAAAGVGEGMIRVSVGIEDRDDLIADFERALA